MGCKFVRIEISHELARDLGRVATVKGVRRSAMVEAILRRAIAAEVVDLEQKYSSYRARKRLSGWWRLEYPVLKKGEQGS